MRVLLAIAPVALLSLGACAGRRQLILMDPVAATPPARVVSDTTLAPFAAAVRSPVRSSGLPAPQVRPVGDLADTPLPLAPPSLELMRSARPAPVATRTEEALRPCEPPRQDLNALFASAQPCAPAPCAPVKPECHPCCPDGSCALP
jgi:hypothetical protein